MSNYFLEQILPIEKDEITVVKKSEKKFIFNKTEDNEVKIIAGPIKKAVNDILKIALENEVPEYIKKNTNLNSYYALIVVIASRHGKDGYPNGTYIPERVKGAEGKPHLVICQILNSIVIHMENDYDKVYKSFIDEVIRTHPKYGEFVSCDCNKVCNHIYEIIKTNINNFLFQIKEKKPRGKKQKLMTTYTKLKF